MTSPVEDDIILDLDLEVDSQAIAAMKASASPQPVRELNQILPKLARRISSQSQSRSPPHSPLPGQSTPSNGFHAHVLFNNSPFSNGNGNGNGSSSLPQTPDSPTHSPQGAAAAVAAARRRNTRKSVRGSLVFQVACDLPPMVAEMRDRDIEPDLDSAALRALTKAAAVAQANQQGGEKDSFPEQEEEEESVVLPDRRVVEGRVIQQGHAQYALTYGMMLGIRVSTGRRDLTLDPQLRLSQLHKVNSMLSEHELTASDYSFSLEMQFPPSGSSPGQSSNPFPTPPHKLPFTFTFKDYMTNVFRALRALGNIEEADYMLSLAGDFNYIEFIANSKSGQFFFYSHDGRYMIKTQTKEECRLLKSIMPRYVQHLSDHPDSLLVKFYGLHRVKMPSLRSKTYFVIMSSVFATPLPIHVKYDLKGSTVGRRTEDKDAVQKDVNLQESGRKIMLGEDQIDVFQETLLADTVFLRDLNIMDYSLLVGIHEAWRGREEAQEQQVRKSQPRRRSSCGVVLSTRYQGAGDSIYNSQNAYNAYVNQLATAYNNTYHVDSSSLSIFQSCCGGIRSAPQAQEIYFIGLIDILQIYNSSKRMETFLRGFQHDKKQVSCVEPSWYAERMLRFVLTHTDYREVLQARKAAAKAYSVTNNPANRVTSKSYPSSSSTTTTFSASSPNNSSAPPSRSNTATSSTSSKEKDKEKKKSSAYDLL